ncbi:hypothetical protein [Sorangium sp. So ce124]
MPKSSGAYSLVIHERACDLSLWTRGGDLMLTRSDIDAPGCVYFLAVH